MRWRRMADVVVVAWLLIAALLLAGGWNYELGEWDDIDAVGYALIIAFHVPLFLRNYAPVPALLLVCCAASLYLALDYYHSVVTFAIALAVFSVAEHRKRRTA